jgi:hypothetical protein
MIPKELQNRTNYIFKDMGGIEKASEVMSEKAMIDAALYDGIVFIIQTEGIRQVFSNDQYSYAQQDGDDKEIYDIELYGYVKGTYYHVLSDNLTPIYKARAERQRLNGVISSYFGHSQEDLSFLASQRHGTVFYLLIETSKGPKMIYCIVNAKVNPQQYYEQLQSFATSARSNPITQRNEIIIYTDSLSQDLRVHLLEGSLQDNYTAQYLSNDLFNTQTIYLTPPTPLYLHTDKSLWFCLREYKTPTQDVVVSVINKPIIEALDLLGGYTEINGLDTVGARNTTLLFTNDVVDSGVEEEILLNIDNAGYISTGTHIAYSPVRLTNIEGEGSEFLLSFYNNTVYFINNRQHSMYGASQASYSLTNKLSTFMKPRAQINITARAELLIDPA